MQNYKRSTRVAELIQRTTAEIIRDFDDLDTAVVSITEVKLSDDLLNCKIYFSIFGNDEEKEKNETILRNNIKEIRHQLALKLNLRRTPEILLIYDDTNEKATKIINILEKIKSGDA
ncbi:MAG: 30S ribosome-binding factor RbfA [Elusimicrobiota bacterium]|jgi:ribosome-binding factor A|nr:30S ribosome-binding factor RbfA [Elusimicrobiota bacterium]